MKSDWTCGPMLRFYIFIRKNDAILFWGGSVLAFMIGGWAGVAWWVLALIAIAIGIPLWMFVWQVLQPSASAAGSSPPKPHR
jgi:hypothetical protein